MANIDKRALKPTETTILRLFYFCPFQKCTKAVKKIEQNFDKFPSTGHEEQSFKGLQKSSTEKFLIQWYYRLLPRGIFYKIIPF